MEETSCDRLDVGPVSLVGLNTVGILLGNEAGVGVSTVTAEPTGSGTHSSSLWL